MLPRHQRKILSREKLVRVVADARADGGTIVHCHGCFDIVHPGHVRYLEFARRQGDLLVVSLTGDPNVNKGDQRPYIPQELRAESLAALEFVDAVYIDPHPTAEAILKDLKPDIYVKGREYEQSKDPRFMAEREIVERNGGRVIFSSGDIVFSSTHIINALPRDPHLEAQRNQVLARRHGVTRESLSAAIDGFRRQRVVIVGDIIIDRYVFCDAINVASESPMMSLAKLDEHHYVGGAAVVARHVAAMGATPVLISAVADDEPSRLVEQVLRDEGVQAHLLRCRHKLVEKTRYLVDETKLFKVEEAEHVPLDSLNERKAAIQIEEHAENADAVIFCDFGYGMISAGLLQRVMTSVRKSVRTVTADISGPRANLLNFRDADLLCPTERELRSNLNDYERGLSFVAHSLLAGTRAKHLFVTLEKKGLVVFDRPTHDVSSVDWSGRLISEHLPSFVDRALDCLGGGDALLAAASLALSTGASLMHAAYLGNAAAAVELSSFGNVPVGANDLHAWVNRSAPSDEPQSPQPAPTIEPLPIC